MLKRIGTLLLICVFLLPATPGVTAYAASNETTQEESLTNTDKSYLAGQLIGEVMDLILDMYAGDMVTAEELFEAALYGISELLDDYSGYMDADMLDSFIAPLMSEYTGIGISVYTNEKGEPAVYYVLPESPAEEAGVKSGDVILSVNGVSTEGLTGDDVYNIIADPEVTQVKLQIRRQTTKKTFNLTKRAIHTASVYTEQLEDILGADLMTEKDAFGYVRISVFGEGTADELREALAAFKQQGYTGVILDLRDNPGGYLEAAVDICEQIVPAGVILHTIDSKGNRDTIKSSLKKKPFDKMVVLVDRNTASAAELVTAALQDAKAAVIIGETTYGKGVIQTLYQLPTGGGFRLTTEEYLRRNGGRVNKVGVTPDIRVTTKSADFLTERDAGLLKALETLRKK